jgi:uncharacterized protein YciI
MTFAAIIEYSNDTSKIAEIRPQHRAYLKQLLDAGQLVISGPFTDDTGGLLVYEAASAEAAEALIQNDPFCKCGVFQTWTVRPWRIVMASPAAIPA